MKRGSTETSAIQSGCWWRSTPPAAPSPGRKRMLRVVSRKGANRSRSADSKIPVDTRSPPSSTSIAWPSDQPVVRQTCRSAILSASSIASASLAAIATRWRSCTSAPRSRRWSPSGPASITVTQAPPSGSGCATMRAVKRLPSLRTSSAIRSSSPSPVAWRSSSSASAGPVPSGQRRASGVPSTWSGAKPKTRVIPALQWRIAPSAPTAALPQRRALRVCGMDKGRDPLRSG
jgi:hypothetical protein